MRCLYFDRGLGLCGWRVLMLDILFICLFLIYPVRPRFLQTCQLKQMQLYHDYKDPKQLNKSDKF